MSLALVNESFLTLHEVIVVVVIVVVVDEVVVIPVVDLWDVVDVSVVVVDPTNLLLKLG